MIPADKGSVSEGFLVRLVNIASYVGASLTTKTELIRKAGLQLEEGTLEDLLLPSHSSSHLHHYDTDLVAAVLESFLMLWRRQSSPHHSSNNSESLHSIRKVAKLILSALESGFLPASHICFPELQMFFTASMLHVPIMQWTDDYSVEKAVQRCDEIWQTISSDKTDCCPGLFFYNEMLHVFYRLRLCDYIRMLSIMSTA